MPDKIRVASWNINSVKAHLPHLTQWLNEAQPDVLLLQELKCLEENFPILEIQALGYRCAIVGQKTYNGVAVLSRHPMQRTCAALAGDDLDQQARYVEVLLDIPAPLPIRIASIYLPNGNPTDSPKYSYKLDWMARLKDHVVGLLSREEILVLGGDYNICPHEDDVYDPLAFANDALFCLPSRLKFQEIVNLGLTDAYRVFHPGPGHYTFWDYQGGAWIKDHGLRIDHLLLSPQAADRLVSAGIDRRPRSVDRPSDHTPVWCDVRID